MMNHKDEDIYSFAGKILRVNLSNGEIRTEPTSKYGHDWLGGPGIAVKILYDELGSWVTPFDPANKLIFGAGPLIGTAAPGANKMNVSTLGPMTGGWASSCSDSYFGGQLKYSGYDLLIIEGRARRPVYLWIQNEKVKICDASVLWGMTTWETLDAIRNLHEDEKLHAVSIGPAGENLVRGACIIQDKGRAMGRCGIGAVMGSKNLKTIVAKGSGSIKVSDKKRFMTSVVACRRVVSTHPVAPITRQYGALGFLPSKQACSGVNYKNFQECTFPEEIVDKIDPRKQIDKYEVRRQSFPGCAFGGCGRHLYITEGPYAGLKTEAPQWEVMSTLQGRLAMEEPTFPFKANAYCNQMGLDVDMAGGSIGWAMECYQRGIIDQRDTDGLELKWGDAGVAIELIRKISHREGFGNILAEGCARAADIIGRKSSHYAVHIKKQDLYENCRGALGWALGATTSTRGGGHTTGSIWFETTAGGVDLEKAKAIYGVDSANRPTDYDGKAAMVTYQEMVHRICNCMGICHFTTISWHLDFMELPEIAEIYSAATGLETTAEDLKKWATTMINLEKAFNLRFTDFSRKDDLPHPRELYEPISTGPLTGWKIDEAKYNRMLDEYYELHGWDKETSFPKRETLVELGLEHVADDLERIGKLK